MTLVMRFLVVLYERPVFTVSQSAVEPSAKTSACLNTVCLAFACFSGGYRCRLSTSWIVERGRPRCQAKRCGP